MSRSSGLILVLCGLAIGVAACGDGSDPGTIELELESLEGYEGLVVSAWVLPLDLTEQKRALGGTDSPVIGEDPFSATYAMHPQAESFWKVDDAKLATFDPGTYRFIIEAYEPAGVMYYGCEQQIRVVGGEPLVVTISNMPTYSGGGWHWEPYEQLTYPDCPQP